MTEPAGFPDLQIVALEDLLLHEDVDLDRVARLLDRLSADGILKNPPIVASLDGSERYLLLDGANRVSAVRNLDIPHLLVQIEPYENPQLRIGHWNHVVRDIEAKRLVDEARAMAGVTLRRGRIDDRVSEERAYLASIYENESEVLHLFADESLPDRVRLLRAIVGVYYRGDARMDRVSHYDVATLREQHPHFGALVSFPDFGKDEVRAVAEAGERLPSGVTRILVPRRVLGFNLRLPLLKSNLPLAEKRRWLKEEIQHKVTDHKVRYYQEPTFVFDD